MQLALARRTVVTTGVQEAWEWPPASRDPDAAQDGHLRSRLRRRACTAILCAVVATLLVHARHAHSEVSPNPAPQVSETAGRQDGHPPRPAPAGQLVVRETQDSRVSADGSAPGHPGDDGLGTPARTPHGSPMTTAGSSPPASGSADRLPAPSRDEPGTDSTSEEIAPLVIDTPFERAGEQPETSAGSSARGPTNVGRTGSLLQQLLDEAGLTDEAYGRTVPVRLAAAPAEPIRPIPEETSTNPYKVALGRALFHDPRLSSDNTIACVSCHDLGSGGDDGRRVSAGVEGRLGPINAPTVFNAGLNFRQFWDGRANTLHEQIDGPVQSTFELGSLWPDVIAKLYDHESYPARFSALYPDGITRETVKDLLAEFMRSLTTPNSRFDQWLRGDDDAITEQEKYGYALFKHYGCVSCHQGANVGGNMFQVFGVVNAYFEKRGNVTPADLGRFNVTGDPADRHAFKVPSLRMAAHTAPYLHDGRADTLRDAVDAMFEFQLGREAPDEDKEAIVAFIRTLAGENSELFQ